MIKEEKGRSESGIASCRYSNGNEGLLVIHCMTLTLECNIFFFFLVFSPFLPYEKFISLIPDNSVTVIYSIEMLNMVLNIAHRGGAGLAPENTVSCFNQGMKFADMIEFDVQPSSDRHLMVFHDRQNIERTSNGYGRIPELSFKYLRTLDVGNWFDSQFQGKKFPHYQKYC